MREGFQTVALTALTTYGGERPWSQANLQGHAPLLRARGPSLRCFPGGDGELLVRAVSSLRVGEGRDVPDAPRDSTQVSPHLLWPGKRVTGPLDPLKPRVCYERSPV